MSWKQERDLLIAQTMAFVQSVTGKPPEAIKAQPETTRPPVMPVVTPTAKPVTVSSVPERSTAPDRPVNAFAEALPARLVPLGQADLRDDIRQRVAAFRARQQLFDRDRDEYCNAMMAKARATSEDAVKLSDDPSPKR
jgi:hypothetical protein